MADADIAAASQLFNAYSARGVAAPSCQRRAAHQSDGLARGRHASPTEGHTMADTTAAPESAQAADLIANVIEEGRELARRLFAFTDYKRDTLAFDAQVEGLDHDSQQYQTAAVRSGLPVLLATVEQLSEALCAALGITDEEVLGGFAA